MQRCLIPPCLTPITLAGIPNSQCASTQNSKISPSLPASSFLTLSPCPGYCNWTFNPKLSLKYLSSRLPHNPLLSEPMVNILSSSYQTPHTILKVNDLILLLQKHCPLLVFMTQTSFYLAGCSFSLSFSLSQSSSSSPNLDLSFATVSSLFTFSPWIIQLIK